MLKCAFVLLFPTFTLAASVTPRLPLAFEENHGQASTGTFLARGKGYSVSLSPDSAVISGVKMSFPNGNRASAGEGENRFPGTVNYFRGADPSKWTRDIPTYEKVRYRNVYPGIDVVYYGDQSQVEFDLVVAPGSDPDVILLDFEGAVNLKLDTGGNLLATVQGRELRIRTPVIFQEGHGVHERIRGSFRLQGFNRVGFQLANYDKRRALIIDPTIIYSTAMGGSGADFGASAAVDASGNIYITGTTYSADFPVTAGAPGSTLNAVKQDMFITKLNAAATAVIYSTYIGGDGSPSNIAVDAAGNAYLAGYTSSPNFPQVSGFPAHFGGGLQGFVLKLSPSGTTLLYSTYLGGSGLESSTVDGLAVDSGGNAYVTGSTGSTNFPTTPGAYSGPLPSQSGSAFSFDVVFLCKVSSAGALTYSSLVGAGEALSVAIDSAGSAYVTGYTNNSTFPAAGNLNGVSDAFIFKMNAAGTALVYSDFLGGSGTDVGQSVAVDSAGQAYVTGYTTSVDFPVTTGAAQVTPGGGIDSFVTKFNAAGSALIYATYLGGRNDDLPGGIAVDLAGNAVVVGQTSSANFPVASAIQNQMAGSLASYSTYNSSLQIWQPADRGLQGIARSVSLNPATGSVVIGTDAGTYRSLSSGGAWTLVSTRGLLFLTRAPSSASVIAGFTSDGAYSSSDDGQTWSGPVAIANLSASGMAIDASVPSTIYAYGANSARSTDSGRSFLALVTPFAINALVVAPGTPNVLLTIQNGQLSRSLDSGATWSAAAGISGSGLAQDPNAPGTVFVFGSGNWLNKSLNGGAAWTQISTPAMVTALVIAPGNSAKLYAVTSAGVITSVDGGSHWSTAAPGLGSASVSGMAANASTVFVLQAINPTGFVTKLNATGTGFVYSTFLGGTGYDGVASVTLFGSDAVIAGYTTSPDIAITAGAVGQVISEVDAFVTRISDATASCAYAVQPSSVAFSLSGGITGVSVESPSACNWNPASASSWISITSNNSSGTAPISIIAAPNTGITRTGSVTVGSQSILVQQAGMACTYTLSASSINIPPTGGSGSVTVTSLSGCGWVTVNGNSQVTVTAGSTGSGNGTVNFTVLPTGGTSTVTYSLIIAGIAYSISQVPSNVSQTITFAAVSTQVLGAGPVSLSATATSGLTVVFASNTVLVCTVSGTIVTLLTGGTCSISATQPGNATYAAAPAVIATFAVNLSQSISFPALTAQTMGSAPFAISATATSGLAVAFASNTTSVCMVSGTTVTLLTGGTCSITASQAGNATYTAAPSLTITFLVNLSQSIIFPALSTRPLGTAPFVLSASATSGLPVSLASNTLPVCTTSGNTVTLVAAGTCSISASQPGNATYAAALTLTNTFTVSLNQSISFTALSIHSLGTAPFLLSATATSGLPIAFASNSLVVCTVSGSTVTLLTPGTCSISASQAGDATYAAAPTITNTFLVNLNQSVNFPGLSNLLLGTAPFSLGASATSGLTVVFASNTPAVCTTSGVTVTLVTVGTCSISGDQPGNATYAAAATVTNTFVVILSQSINFAAVGTLPLGTAPFSLSATATSGLAVTFASNTTSICTVSGITVTLVNGGLCSVSASQSGSATYAAAPNVTNAFLVNINQSISFTTLSNRLLGTAPFVLSATATSGLVVGLTSNTASVCTVSGATVTLLAGGNCSISANQPGNANYTAAPTVTNSFSVNVNQSINFTAVNTQSLGIAPFLLSATATSGLTVVFASNTTSVCTMSGAMVTLLAGGTCSITASQPGNAIYLMAPTVNNGFVVTINQSISFPGLSSRNLGAAPFILGATATSGLTVAFTSNTALVCVVSAVTVTLLTAGTCSISADQAGNATYAAALTVTNSFVVNLSQSINFTTINPQYLGIPPFLLNATATSGLSVAFASITPSVCTVSGMAVTVLNGGTCSIIASQPGNATYAAAPNVANSFPVSINQSINFPALSNRLLGTAPFVLSATVTSGLSVVFTSNTASVCVVSGITLTLLAAGNCSVSADQPGNGTYTAAPTAINSFVVNVSQSINFTAVNTQSLGSAPFPLSATTTSGLAVAFASNTPPVCTVSGSTVTLLTGGTCSISASQPGNSIYVAAPTVTNVFLVNVNQSISFPGLGNRLLGTAPFVLGATAASGLAIVFNSNSPLVCAVSGVIVTLLGGGICSISANQPGSAIYTPAPAVTNAFMVNVNQTISFAAVNVQSLGAAPFLLSATATSGLTVAFASNTPSVCTVSGAAVTLLTGGTCSISASQPGNSTFTAAAVVTNAFVVNLALRYVAITPCRIADTRNAAGPFGGPIVAGQTVRSFAVTSSACGIPSSAQTYSLNIVVDPPGPVGYLTVWPTGEPQPLASTLNSDGRTKANAAIVPAGAGGAISLYVTETTHVIVDINGYFVSAATPGSLAFYPLTPCRISDTRNPNAPLGGPSLLAQSARTIPVLSSPCNIPATAQAYSLNFTAVPPGPFGYLSVWQTGQPQPLVSTLNAPTGATTANAAIVPAGTNGSINLFASHNTDLVIDINGYFAPPASGGLSFFNLQPCRILDTRNRAGALPFKGTLDIAVTSAGCGAPLTAQAFVFNATLVPVVPFGYLSFWAQGARQPVVSTLNAPDGATTDNMAIVPTANGSISAFAADFTQLILDILGYFAP